MSTGVTRVFLGLERLAGGLATALMALFAAAGTHTGASGSYTRIPLAPPFIGVGESMWWLRNGGEQ